MVAVSPLLSDIRGYTDTKGHTEENIMDLLIAGLIAFIGLHLIPYFGIRFRIAAIGKIGRNGYRGLFSLAVGASFAAIIFGWRETIPEYFYTPPAWGIHVTPLFTLVAFILFIASNAPTNIKRYVRHPQMTGILLWSVGHLLSNGEERSALLFGSFALWSVVAILASNRRDGEWEKAEPQSRIKDIITIVIALILYGAAIYYHEAVIGVRPML
jgi:uncharacterized membrane protein